MTDSPENEEKQKKSEKFFFSDFFRIFVETLKTSKTMKKYKVFYKPGIEAGELAAIIPAASIKEALTRFNAAGFEGEILCIQDLSFDFNLFNF